MKKIIVRYKYNSRAATRRQERWLRIWFSGQNVLFRNILYSEWPKKANSEVLIPEQNAKRASEGVWLCL